MTPVPIEEAMSSTTIKATTASEEANLDSAAFDVASWIAGVQPVRRATTIYSRCDLLADLDLIKEQLANEKTASTQIREVELRARASEIVEEINKSAVDVVVVGWSAEKIKNFHADCKAAGMSDEDAALTQVAAQIVAPEGFTRDHLETLREYSGTQLNAIIGIVSQANNAPIQVSVPF